MTVDFRKGKSLEVAIQKWIKMIKGLRGEYTDNHAKLAELIKSELPKLLSSAENIPTENAISLEDLNELRQKHTNFFDKAQNLTEIMAEQLRNLILLAEDVSGMEFASDIPSSAIELLKNEETLLSTFDKALLDLSKSVPSYLRNSAAQNDLNESIKQDTFLAFAKLQDGILDTERILDSLFNVLREHLNLAKDLERSRIA